MINKLLSGILAAMLMLPAVATFSGMGFAPAYADTKSKEKKLLAKKKRERAKKEKKKKSARSHTREDDDDDDAPTPPPHPVKKSGSTATAVVSTAAGAAGHVTLAKPVLDEANKALDIVQHLCLKGSQVKFGLDLSGKLNISKRTPEGSLSASVDAVNVEGAVLFQSEEIRRLVDQDIRTCMIQQWPQVLQILKSGK